MSDPDPDPYLLIMNPDQWGPKTCGFGSGSPTLVRTLHIFVLPTVDRQFWYTVHCACAEPSVCSVLCAQGVTKRCRLSLLIDRALVYRVPMRGHGVVAGGVSANEYSCAHNWPWRGAQINFVDLPLYLTYVCSGPLLTPPRRWGGTSPPHSLTYVCAGLLLTPPRRWGGTSLPHSATRDPQDTAPSATHQDQKR